MSELDAASQWLLNAENWTAASGPAPAALADWWRASEHPDAGCPHAAEPDVDVMGLLHAPGVCWCPTDAAAVHAAHLDVGAGCDGCGTLTAALRVAMWRLHPRVAVLGVLCPECLNPDPNKENPR